MAHFEDLAPCDDVQDARLPGMLAVGWLEPEHEFVVGEVPGGLVPRLRELCRSKSPWPFLYVGGHPCRFCKDPASYSPRNLFVPGNGVLYVSPLGIVHYIEKHAYRPPDAFIDAVLAAPDPGSREYAAVLLACGWPEQYLADWS